MGYLGFGGGWGQRWEMLAHHRGNRIGAGAKDHVDGGGGFSGRGQSVRGGGCSGRGDRSLLRQIPVLQNRAQLRLREKTYNEGEKDRTGVGEVKDSQTLSYTPNKISPCCQEKCIIFFLFIVKYKVNYLKYLINLSMPYNKITEFNIMFLN